MINYKCCSSNHDANQAVAIACNIVNKHLQGKEVESLQLTPSFFESINKYLFGKNTFIKPNKDNNYYDELYELFCKKITVASEAKWNEYQLAYQRANDAKKGEKMYGFGYEHNASFIDWFLCEIGLIDDSNKSSELSKIRKEYLTGNNFAFKHENEKTYKGRAMMFYRNAYRAEMYSHKIITMTDPNGFNDMYTPLILSRMAVEQYLKALYEEKFNHEAPSKPSECRKALKHKGHISKSLSNEIYAVLERGNTNTHEGYASYPFAIIHNLELLKMCLNYFDSKK